MKTLGHPGLILTPEKPELKSRHPPKNKGFEEPDLPRDKSNYEPNPIGQYPYATPAHYSKAPHALGGLHEGSELSYSNILLKAGEVEVAKHCGTEKRPLLRLCIFTSHHAQLVRHDRPCTNIAINNFSIIISSISIIIGIIIALLSGHRKLKHVGQSSSCTMSSRNPTQAKKVSSSHQITRGWVALAHFFI